MRIFSVIACLMMALFLMISSASTVDAARQKSMVLLVFNDQSGRDTGERLSEIAHQELGKKINGIYNVVDAKPYEAILSDKSHFTDTVGMFNDLVSRSGADYFVYVELMPFRQAEGFNVIWHRKKMVAHMGLRIIDIHNNKDLFEDQYEIEKNDDTDFLIVGSPSMARKSLRGALFITGEAISVHLPL